MLVTAKVTNDLYQSDFNCTTCFFSSNGECTKKKKSMYVACPSYRMIPNDGVTCEECVYETKCKNPDVKEDDMLCSEFSTVSSGESKFDKNKRHLITDISSGLLSWVLSHKIMYLDMNVDAYPMLEGLPLEYKDNVYDEDEQIDLQDLGDNSILMSGYANGYPIELFMYANMNTALTYTDEKVGYLSLSDYQIEGLSALPFFSSKEDVTGAAMLKSAVINPTIRDFEELTANDITDFLLLHAGS